MLGALPGDPIETGLFTFYMSDNKQNYFQKRSGQQNLTQLDTSICSANRRKQQNRTKLGSKLKAEEETLQEARLRQEKLNKFLINCVGAERRLKSIQNTVSHAEPKRYTEPIPTLLLKQSEMQDRMFLKISDNQMQRKDYQYQNSKNKNVKNSMKLKYGHVSSKESKIMEAQRAVKIENKVQKQNEMRVANYSIVNLNIESHSRQSRSQSDQHSNKQKDKVLRSHQKHKKLTLNQKHEGYAIERRVQIYEKDKQDEEQILKQKINCMDKSVKLTQLYPRLIKHHSEQLCIKATQLNGISIMSITPTLPTAPSNIQNQRASTQRNQKLGNLHQPTNAASNIASQVERNQINQLKNSAPPLRLPQIKESKKSRHKNYYSNQNLKSLPKNIYMAQVSSHIYEEQEKRKNRLEQIYKNKRTQLGLQLGLLLNNRKEIEGQKHINQLYYSIDNRQKKALQINFGAESKCRIFNDFDQRKKILIQKMNEFSDRKGKGKIINGSKQMKSRKSKLKLQENKKLL